MLLIVPCSKMQGQEMMATPGGHTGELHGRKQIKKNV
jgi:hypothetical protein